MQPTNSTNTNSAQTKDAEAIPSLDRYADFLIRSSSTFDQAPLDAELLIGRNGDISTYYAPFEHINDKAKIVICGITPGLQQAKLALTEARRRLLAGYSIPEAQEHAKKTASFGGPMRANLIKLLDFIGINKKLNLRSSSDLFENRTELVHYTSALRYPVFKSNKNYSGTPSMLAHSELRNQVDTFLTAEARILGQDTLYVPLGPKVEEALSHLIKKGELSQRQVLSGLPHPSGANAERIAFFLNQKPRELLSIKTNPYVIEKNRERLLTQMASI